MLSNKMIRCILIGLWMHCVAGISCTPQNTENDGKDRVTTTGRSNITASSSANNKEDAQRLSDYQPGVVLIKFKQNYLRLIDKDYSATLKKLGVERLGARTSQGLDVVKITTNETVREASSRLSRDTRIEYAEPNWRIGLLAVPNDTLFPDQWGLHNTGQVVLDEKSIPFIGIEDADIDAVEAWDMAKNYLDEIIVAIVDTGVAYDHVDLAANMWTNQAEIQGQPDVDDDGNGKVDDLYGWNFAEDNNDAYDLRTHGTHLAGILGAVGNDSDGVIGVAWNAKVKIMSLRIMRDTQPSSAFVSDAVEAFGYAVDNGAKIINCSWWTQGRKSQALQDAVASAENHGVVIVSAAGNFSLDIDEDTFNAYPAEYENDNVFSVAATDNQDRAARFTNWGLGSVDVAAPGVAIMSTLNSRYDPDKRIYGAMSGTSMASPLVAGAIAVMLQHKPDLVMEQGPGSYDFSPLREALFASVDPIPDLEGKIVTAGRINLHRALRYIDGQNLSPVARVGGAKMHRVGMEVVLDGSVSFDPEGGNISAYNWSLKAPGNSHTELEILGSSVKFVPDVCGYYEVTLTVETRSGISHPNVTNVLAMNWEPLKPHIESAHPYYNNFFESLGTIQKPGATLIASHISQLELEFGWDLVGVSPKNLQNMNQFDRYTGIRHDFTGAVFEDDTLYVHFESDEIESRYGVVVDSFFWCNQNSSCSPGMGDCDLDPTTGEGGCETDLANDPGHCGWCDHSCSNNGEGGVCVDGKCVSSQLVCHDGYADCNQESYDGCETHLSKDIENCGQCGNLCDFPNVSFSTCNGGLCLVASCEIDENNDIRYADCNGTPDDGCEIDLMNDANNCGTCHRDCALLDPKKYKNVESFTGDCELGLCETICKPGWYDCNKSLHDGCESDLSDSQNCGQCSRICSFPWAEGICVDPSTGTCGLGPCAFSHNDCDQDPQNGCETLIIFDINNCGSCGNVCPEAQNAMNYCFFGTCGMYCIPGFADCDNDEQNGCETDTTNDIENCGSCSYPCMPYANATTVCVEGTCQMSCNEPYVDCDGSIGTGCEIDIDHDPSNCGECGKQCSGADHADPACEQGDCALACKANYGDCDGNTENGCEIDLSLNKSHCGACNTACGQKNNATSLCDQGVCVHNCNEGYGDCNASMADGCEAKLDNLGQCPEEESEGDGGCNTGGSPRTALPIFLFMLSGLLWLRRYCWTS